MRISIHHEIVQEFSPPLKSAIQVLRLRPKEFESQHIAAWNVDVDMDCRMREARDTFGNHMQTLDCEGPIDRIVIHARGEVDTFDTSGVLRGEQERFATDVFLRDTDLTIADAALRDFAHKTVKGAKTKLDRPHFLMRALHELLELTPDKPSASASDAFARKAGAAVDFAHVFIAAARIVGVPARCIGGYLAPEPEEQKAGSTGALHAWAEAYVEGLGWIGFDPTICLCMHDGHVRVACGLDYLGASPLRLPPLPPGKRVETISVRPSQAMSQRQA